MIRTPASLDGIKPGGTNADRLDMVRHIPSTDRKTCL